MSIYISRYDDYSKGPVQTKWRAWLIDDETDQPLATFDGFADPAAAQAHLDSIVRVIAQSKFSAPWPQGVARFSMPYKMVRDEPDGPLRHEDEAARYIPDGPVQFGDREPGVFLGAHACRAYVMALRILEKNPLMDEIDAFTQAGMRGMLRAFEAVSKKGNGNG